MIAALRGVVLGVSLGSAVVEVGGIGLEVHATPATLAGLRPGTEVRLVTTLVVREDALTLYGFADAEARDLFVLLQTVSGVGPRLALAALAVLEPAELRRALSEADLAALIRVPGVGRKGAERLVVELRDRVVPVPVRPGTTGGRGARRDEVVAALVGLGFAGRQAEQSVDAVLAAGADGGPADTASVLRSALARLGGGR